MENVILKNRAVTNFKRLVSDGYTQQELADFGGVTRQQVNRILMGHSKPEIDTCEAIAVSLGMIPEALLLEPDAFEKILLEICVTSS